MDKINALALPGAFSRSGTGAYMTSTVLDDAWDRHIEVTQDFNSSYNMHFQPGDITLPDWPDLVQNPSIICVIKWLVLYNAWIELSIACLEANPTDAQAAEDCIEGWYNLILGTNALDGCIVASS